MFNDQLRNNPVYSSWIRSTKRPKTIRSLSDLTFLPISFFKSRDIKTGSYDSKFVFKSSGTTGQIRSKHHVCNLQDYYDCCSASFNFHFDPLTEYRHLFFLPFYQKNPESSLLAMTNYFLESTKSHGSKYLNNLNEIEGELLKSNVKTVLWTVTYGAMDILEAKVKLNHPNLTFIETGGSKGKREVLPRKELHRRIKLLAPNAFITSEYGMCELSHQAYFLDGSFQSLDSLWPVITDVQDPFSILPLGSRGRLCWIDFGNTHSCPFIETEDIAVLLGERRVSIEGRLDHAELRGCNLMYG